MKKKVSGLLAVISLIGSIVTIFTDKTVQNIAKIITLLAICFFVISIFNMMCDYLKNGIKKFKELVEVLRAIEQQPTSTARIDEMVENMVVLKKNVVELDKKLADMSQKNMDINLGVNQIWKKVKDYEDKFIERLDGKSYFQYRTTDVTVQLKRLIDTKKEIDEIHIVCFGRSGYGEVAQYIVEKKLPIKIKIVLCNPKKNEFINSDSDVAKIKELIKVMDQCGADIYLSDIPPTIRASTVYIQEKAIWSVMQSYQFQRGVDDCLELMRPKDSQDSLIVVCDENSSKRDFDGIVKCFESEFERLLNNSEHLKANNL